jgi:hypothetical protein
MERNYKDDGSSTRMNEQTGDHWNGPYEIQDHIENRSTTTINKYPQVGKNVDAVHGSCPQMVYIMKEIKFVNLYV